ncbi:MAG: hypothetical protein JO301_17015 [Chitinophagaceae bacterium]|nr:hypothetical protein [Chitinophagaceae bacterium]
MELPAQYKWLLSLPVLPKMVAEGLKLLACDTQEVKGEEDNPVIMGLAKEAGVADIYTHDEMAWCALAHTVIALRAGKEVPFQDFDRLRAKSFENFGQYVTTPKLGDTLVFARTGGSHVGIYIGEDETAYHVMGGNQSDRYCITRILKGRLTVARRPVYKSGQPETVKTYQLTPNGMSLSKNEA